MAAFTLASGSKEFRVGLESWSSLETSSGLASLMKMSSRERSRTPEKLTPSGTSYPKSASRKWRKPCDSLNLSNCL